jgi:pyruvate formate lyase activating enzyme
MTKTVTTPPVDTSFTPGCKSGGWWHKSDEPIRIVCDLCPRHCVLRPGERGFCFVRENRDGQIVSTAYGRSTGFCVDPIEKKPLNQFYPGTAVLSFGTAGCNLGCTFCQNWTMSRSRDVEAACETASPDTIAAAAVKLACRSVAFTYNDPIIWAEYAIDTAKACHGAGIKNVAVTSGYITDTARPEFYKHVDAANVDLKGFTDDFYRQYCAGRLQSVLDTLRYLARETNVWLEITNLIIPQANDAPDDIKRMCEWIVKELGPDVPLHFSAFHPDFKMTDRGPTPVSTLLSAYDIARSAGIRYIYTGNVIDHQRQHTYCPECGKAVIQRNGYDLLSYSIIPVGRISNPSYGCAFCQKPIAGRFDDQPGTWGSRRQPVRIANFA